MARLTGLDTDLESDLEADLLAGLRAGRPEAQRKLFEREGEAVWRVAYRLVGDYDVAQDVVQEAFVKAFHRIRSFDGRGPLAGWVRRVAVNTARDALRRDGRRSRRFVAMESVTERGERPDDRQHLRERLREAVEALPDGQREVVLMHDVEGFTHEEIGAALGIVPGSSRARLSRARSALRELLADFAPEVTG